MQDKKIAEYKQAIADVPSLTLIDFDNQPEWIAPVLYGETDKTVNLGTINIQDKSIDQQTEWIISILKQHKITGNCLLSFSGLPFAKVELSADYQWVKAIWAMGQIMIFVPIDQAYCLFVKWTEACVSSNCINIFMLKNPTK